MAKKKNGVGNEVWREFAGPVEAAKILKVATPGTPNGAIDAYIDQSNISKCLRGRLQSTGGWIFKYRDESEADQHCGEEWKIVRKTPGYGTLLVSSFGRVRTQTNKQSYRVFTPRPAPPAPYDSDEASGYV